VANGGNWIITSIILLTVLAVSNTFVVVVPLLHVCCVCLLSLSLPLCVVVVSKDNYFFLPPNAWPMPWLMAFDICFWTSAAAALAAASVAGPGSAATKKFRECGERRT
jgi:hypothetical protein